MDSIDVGQIIGFIFVVIYSVILIYVTYILMRNIIQKNVTNNPRINNVFRIIGIYLTLIILIMIFYTDFIDSNYWSIMIGLPCAWLNVFIVFQSASKL
jgi:hypothetical protein